MFLSFLMAQFHHHYSQYNTQGALTLLWGETPLRADREITTLLSARLTRSVQAPGRQARHHRQNHRYGRLTLRPAPDTMLGE
jgi:hypothetical protein